MAVVPERYRAEHAGGWSAGIGGRISRLARAPFLSGTPIPQADAPPRRAADGARPAAGSAIAGALDEIGRALHGRWMAIVFVRAAWLSFAVGAALLWLARPRHEVGLLLLALLAALAVWLLGCGVALAIRPSPRGVAHLLDRTFDLQDRLTTSLDGGPATGLAARQRAEAVAVLAKVAPSPVLRPRVAPREIALLALALAAFLALLWASLAGLRGPSTRPAADAAADTAAPPPSSRQVAPAAPPSAQSPRSAEAQRALDALAQALRDHAVTRSAAE
ncbi:MAG: hypothetical protein IRY97_10825, partial [Thermomicrobiaceae bacterium]|nr:hypothetical protein [Thermomicrobiaceae bacterium]